MDARLPSRTGATDTFQVDNGAFFEMSGTSAYPASFTTYTYGATSTVRYLQTAAATVAAATYGHLEIATTYRRRDQLGP